ncbi:MAG: sodium/glutamate symporter, partial [Rhodobacteraceae bacterium]|nr:sodium/glutamate symporter [Paracoccaceae bacterium]
MEGAPEVFVIEDFAAVTVGLLVYIIGVNLTARVRVLRDFNIPEPVSGGLLVALITMIIFSVWNVEIEFDLASRDYFLVLFFSTIGMNARMSYLAKGGKPLVYLLGLTIAFIFLQNVIGQIGVLV